MYVSMVIACSRVWTNRVRGANPARGQLNRENKYSPARACLRIWSRETNSAVPSRISLLISVLRLNLVTTYGIPPELQLKKLQGHNKSAIDLSNANPAHGHKDIPRSTSHIMVTTRYSDQQEFKSRKKVMRLYSGNGTDQYQNDSPKLLAPYREQPRSTRIVVAYPRLASCLSNKTDKLHTNQL